MSNKLTDEQIKEINGGKTFASGIYVMINYSGRVITGIEAGGGFYKGPYASEELAIAAGIDYCKGLHETGYSICSYQVFINDNGQITNREIVFA